MRETKIPPVFAVRLTLSAAFFAALLIAGCGTPGAPAPPSLTLPDTVVDLAATRTGNQVALAWTMPKKNTDKLLIKGEITARVCRKEPASLCTAVPGDRSFPPQAKATFTETLPAELAAGPARPLAYFIELRNSKGRSAGLSNAAAVLAGQAPGPVAGLVAKVRKDGVVLRWSDGSTAAGEQTAIRLQRKLLTPTEETHHGGAVDSTTQHGKTSASQDMLPAPREPIEQNLLVEPSAQASSKTIDKSIRFGATYEYRAQRVARVTIGNDTLELAGPLSEPVRIEALDVFPPDVPTGLVAVAIAADSSAGPAIDLSWQPVTDADLAGYAVYRRESSEPDAAWHRISTDLVVGPGFHDPQVQPGQGYRYAVTAIDQKHHESARSAEAQETVPST